MITKNEISSLNLSPTKKDFVQIWNELMEVASKITERWDPTSTNESDPGIVLLKVLTGIADKLNYNIDKNILEAFMPTAAQMESMRKLCELVGYDIKYYQSAETKVRISYTGNTHDEEEKLPISGLLVPKFTTITNADKDITFVTTNAVPVYITNDNPWVEVSCIEGQISQCESINENNLITLAQLDDEYRYYLPEIQIAENGIFVYNAAVSSNGTYVDGSPWEQVSNLNTRSTETRVFKFGYDSFEGRPYLAFPDDIGSLIGDGLFIYFIRTSGLNGNISPRTLEVLEVPTGEGWDNYSAEQFEVVNADATTNGANTESISAAYNNFKKTVGTFDTLVTCRDYMNKIYSLMDASNSPYVSNILVTDIRNDINSAITLCSCNEFGILYKETPLTKTDKVTSTTTATNMSVANLTDAYGNIIAENKLTIYTDKPVEVETEVPLIDHFDLVLYPFKTFTQVSSGTEDLVKPYNKSFEYSELMNREIEASLADFKTCAHNFATPVDGDIIAINNYLRLDALIATSNKVSEIEASSILQNVKVALVNEFNMRNLAFGEEIPFDNILSVIENADSRIKVVSLQEPTVLTTYSVKVQTDNGATSKEYGIASIDSDKIANVEYAADGRTAKNETVTDIYNKLTLRNILAGRASLFDYDETFIPNNSEKPYTITKKLDLTEIDEQYLTDAPGEHVLPIEGPNGGVVTLRVFPPQTDDAPDILPEPVLEAYETYTPLENDIIDDITRVEAICEISGNNGVFENITLAKNEVIKFRAPNLITTKTFPAYVYYRFERAGVNAKHDDVTSDGSYAAVISLASFINSIGGLKFFTGLWNKAADDIITFEYKKDAGTTIDQSDLLPSIFNAAIAVGEIGSTNIWSKESDFRNYLAGLTEPKTFKYYPLTDGTMPLWSEYIRACYTEKYNGAELPDGSTTLWRLSSTSSFPKGKLVTEAGQRLYAQGGDYLLNTNVSATTYICTDPGSDPIFSTIQPDSDVELQAGDKLYIHYTPSSTNEDGETINAEPISIVYEGGSATDPVILKPSGFTLTPSEDVRRQGTSWKKTDVDFGSHGKKNLLALAPNEQIELRSISKVVLDRPARFYKNFDDAKLEQGDINAPYSYELKDGEYIFYTDQNNQGAAYYGSGSVITLSPGAYIPKASDTVEVSQILEQGLHIVPWSNLVLLSTDRTVTVTEYQYVTLVDGDTLNTLTVTAGNTLNKSEEFEWQKCDQEKSPVFYTTAGAETPTKLPKMQLGQGVTIGWEVCSLLELSTSPGYAQQLRATDSVTNKIKVFTGSGVDERLAYEIKPEKSDTTGDYEKVSVKLNTIAQSASGELEKADDSVSIQMKVFKEEAPTKVELTEHNDVITPISDKHSVSAETSSDNINNYLTKVDINELWRSVTEVVTKTDEEGNPVIEDGNEVKVQVQVDRPNALKLNFMIPKDVDVFGIFSIYLEVPVDKLNLDSKQNIPTKGSRVFIDVPSEFGDYKQFMSIFNNNDDWWSEGIDAAKSNRLYLRAGLNCIKVTKSCSLLIKAEKEAAGSILYDNMRLVKGVKTNGINLKLLDPNTTFNTDTARIAEIEATRIAEIKSKEEQTAEDKAELEAFENTKEAFENTKEALANKILDHIAKLDKNHDFYYNVPVENSLAIEFDNNINSFSNPYTFYDINNVNNSFVISKLDVDYLDDGLRIAKSSRY